VLERTSSPAFCRSTGRSGICSLASRSNLRCFYIAWTLLLLLGACVCAAPVLAIPQAGQGDPTPAADPQGIPRESLLAMYQTELGDRFHPDQAAALYQAHALLESFFATPGMGQRRSIIKSIEATGIDAATIGHLARLRMNWPQLQAGVYYVNEKRGPFNVRYFLGIPKAYDRTKSWPLVVMLPPAERLLLQPPGDAQGVVDLFNGWISDELTRHADAVVLIPLPELATLYGPGATGVNGVIQAMLHAGDRVNVDPARVYLFGQSLSAFASWNIALHYPTYFASFAALAGGARADWQRVRLQNLLNTPPIVWADADDKVVRPEQSRVLVRVLKGLKVDVDYQETKGQGHTPDAATLEDRYQHMRLHVRALYPPQLRVQSTRPEVVFNRVDWIQMWQPQSPGAEHRIPIRRGGSLITTFDNSDNVRANRDGNQIDLTVDNVESLRLLLNDQMVDFAQPITVTVNKKVKFQGKVQPSIEQMLMDQIVLGRGWRYYTAALDIDLVDRPTSAPTTRPTTGPSLRRGRITVGPGAAG
jgi:predicted esterase